MTTGTIPIAPRMGAFAMLDALGFKGIWSSNTYGDVVHKLQAVERSATQAALLGSQFVWSDPPALSTSATCISDTVAIGTAASVDVSGIVLARPYPLTALDALGGAAARVQLAGLTGGEPGLAYRGVISWGDFVMRGSFIIGPAVDESAAQERDAEASIMWLSRSGLEALGGERLGAHWMEYDVPMKKGPAVRTFVVNPFALAWLEQDIYGTPEEVAERWLKTFGRSAGQPGADVKKANTESFLRAALEAIGPPER